MTDDTCLQLTIPARLVARGRTRVATAIRSASSAWMLFWSEYALFRRPVLRFFLAHVLPVWSRCVSMLHQEVFTRSAADKPCEISPVPSLLLYRSNMYAMMRHNGSYSVTLAARAFSSALFIFLVFESTHVLFEVYATQVSTRRQQACVVRCRG